MSLFAHITCLEAQGHITGAQKSRMSQIASSLPNARDDLLAIIAALSIMNNDDENILGEAPIGVESITSTGTGDVHTLIIPSGATRAIISVHTNNIIFRVDGGIPAAAVGHIGKVNENFIVGALEDFKFVASAANSVVFVSYF